MEVVFNKDNKKYEVFTTIEESKYFYNSFFMDEALWGMDQMLKLEHLELDATSKYKLFLITPTNSPLGYCISLPKAGVTFSDNHISAMKNMVNILLKRKALVEKEIDELNKIIKNG